MTFTSHVRSVSLARRLVCRRLCRWGHGTDAIDVMALIASELATNAVQHAPGRYFHVRLLGDDGQIRIEVSDTLRAEPRRMDAGPDDERGRGLTLVAELADSFGSHPRDGIGKTVWAVVTVPRPPRGSTVASDTLAEALDESPAVTRPAAPARRW
ncbi:ATP-binding protein [Streptomyces smaragdinus]|nr:ATP-binding protein [Streptomyces smaragdinus]